MFIKWLCNAVEDLGLSLAGKGMQIQGHLWIFGEEQVSSPKPGPFKRWPGFQIRELTSFVSSAITVCSVVMESKPESLGLLV